MRSSLVQLPELDDGRQVEIEKIVNHSLKKHSVNVNRQTLTADIYERMKQFANRPITKNELELMIEDFGEKTVILYVFNGDRGSYYDTLKGFKDEEYEKDLIKQGLHPLYVTEEDAKLYHSEAHIGTHSPVISTHYNKLGSVHGKETLFNNGLIYELYKKGVIMELKPEDIMEYVFVKFNRHIPKPMATEVANDINKQRMIFEGSIFTGRIGDDMLTQKALEKVTAYCRKTNQSYEKSNEMGKKARLIAKQVENTLGREIGSLVVKEEHIGTAEVIANVVTKLCTCLNTPVEDVGGLIKRPVKRK